MHAKLLLIAIYSLGCTSSSTGPAAGHPSPQEAGVSGNIHKEGGTLATRLLPPAGYSRAVADGRSFGHFLRNIPLRPHGAPVLLHNGSPKRRQDVHAAVLNVDAGTRDLQQCADAVMRLRAEYLFAQGRLSDIHFNFTSGFRAEFSRWAKGDRIAVSRDASWRVGAASADASHRSLRRFLDQVYSYAGTLSLAKELRPVVVLPDLQAGDVFIHGGSPGHAVIVMDVAQNATGEKLFLLAQSYMPAQDIHVLVNPSEPGISPWYRIPATGEELATPEWTFAADELKRFAE